MICGASATSGRRYWPPRPPVVAACPRVEREARQHAVASALSRVRPTGLNVDIAPACGAPSKRQWRVRPSQDRSRCSSADSGHPANSQTARWSVWRRCRRPGPSSSRLTAFGLGGATCHDSQALAEASAGNRPTSYAPVLVGDHFWRRIPRSSASVSMVLRATSFCRYHFRNRASRWV
jgi:hypothetical protein